MEVQKAVERQKKKGLFRMGWKKGWKDRERRLRRGDIRTHP